MNNKRTVSIVGLGPRGVFALENLIAKLKEKNSLKKIHVLLFEQTENLGNGQVYGLEQNSANWLNISERFLEVKKREVINLEGLKIPSFSSYQDWANVNYDELPKTYPDQYPLRSKMGEYLKKRFHSFITPLLKAKIITIHQEKVIKVTLQSNHKVTVDTNISSYKDIDEVLLTIGHQPTEYSKQIKEWNQFVKDNVNCHLFKSAYPLESYLDSGVLKDKTNIGVRGFGLAMIDAVRGIASHFGSFASSNEDYKSCVYSQNKPFKGQIIPFSLDGLPPVPKPLNAEIDGWFAPTKTQLKNFETIIGEHHIQKEARNPNFLIEAIAPIVAEVFLALPNNNLKKKLSLTEINTLVQSWIKDNSIRHTIITPIDQSAEQSMKDFVGMALGIAPISLDYCIGQVWRQCQPSIYKQLSHNDCNDEVFADIIKLDEVSKRYSYGPPVESIQQLLALIDTKVLNLDFINDPEIEATDKGWSFKSSNKVITTTVMIDSVLASPKIKSVDAPLVKNMLTNDLIEAVHNELGVVTDDQGYLISKNEEMKLPIALLGRLAKGTVIGVDAILECFGERPKTWSNKAAENHLVWLESNS